MNKTTKSGVRAFDAASYLNTEADIVAYLDTILEDDDPALLAAALGDIAKASTRAFPASVSLQQIPCLRLSTH